MVQQSLNTTSADAIANGTEIKILVAGITVGEIYELDYDEDNKVQEAPVLGSRVISYRFGQFVGKGSIKAYWLNKALRTIVMGGPVSANGMASSIYASQSPFFRFNIVVSSTNPTAPNCTLVNCVVEKDAVKFASDKLSNEDVSFVYEDRLGQ